MTFKLSKGHKVVFLTVGTMVMLTVLSLIAFFIYKQITPTVSQPANYQLNMQLISDVLFQEEQYTEGAIERDTKMSYAMKERQLEVVDEFGFAPFEVNGQEILYRDHKPYTGWLLKNNQSWDYYEKGKANHSRDIDAQNALIFSRQFEFIKALQLAPYVHEFYLQPVVASMEYVKRYPVRYSILHRGGEGIILSNAPGERGSRIIGNTKGLVDMPMEIIEEVVVNGKTWIHANIGYHELGWIEADTSYQDYVLTNYSERRLLDEIESVLVEEMANIPGPIGASFVNHETMAQVDVDNQIFFPASTQKIYVLAQLYHRYQLGEITPETTMVMEGENIVGGAGVIGGFTFGDTFTLDALVDFVAIYSDNTAANMLIDAAGTGVAVTDYAHELGMRDTFLEGKYYGHENGLFQTTPHDAALLFAKLARNEVNGAPWDEMLINKLRLNTHTFLRQHLWNVDSYNKSGLGEPEQNDVATFNTAQGSYSIAVYTSSWENQDGRYDQVGHLGTRILDVFTTIRSDLWHPYNPELGFYQN